MYYIRRPLPAGRRVRVNSVYPLPEVFARGMAQGGQSRPDKSYNVASTVEGKKWLEQTWWEGIQAKIQVVQDFRYL